MYTVLYLSKYLPIHLMFYMFAFYYLGFPTRQSCIFMSNPNGVCHYVFGGMYYSLKLYLYRVSHYRKWDSIYLGISALTEKLLTAQNKDLQKKQKLKHNILPFRIP